MLDSRLSARIPTAGGQLRRSVVVLAGLAIGGLSGCAGQPTEIVVRVESDLSSSEVASVRAVVGGSACLDAACARDFPITADEAFPFSFVITPSGDSSRVDLVLDARASDGAVLVHQGWETDFVAGRRMLLVVRLDRACIASGCDTSSETCSEGVCVARRVEPSALPDVTPGSEFRDAGDSGMDGGSPNDAAIESGADAGDDADPPDVGDGGLVVARCADLPGIAPSGATLLDPDGPGGDAPFEGWCNNDDDDGGWTLIAKVEPTSPRLGFDASEWTASAAMPFGTVDEGVGDALLRTYWTVPLTELRIGNGTDWMITRLDSPASSLRAAMEAAATLDATQVMWRSVVDLPPISGAPCVRSGLAVRIPSASAPELRVRIGLAASNASDCTEPTLWYGLGADVATSDASCVATTNTSGGARVCGPPGQRRTESTRLLVYGR